MSELTPERIRDAAAVVDQCPLLTGAHIPSGALRTWATQVQREQAAEAKREKRVKELAHEMRVAAIPAGSGQHWEAAAEALLDRYPALADGPEL